MKYVLVITVVLTHLVRTAVGQTPNVNYHLSGIIDADTGTVILLPTGGKDFDPNLHNVYETKIKQGHFAFEGQMAYPGGYLIACFPKYVSSSFLIEPGDQTIRCRIDSIREIPQISNASTADVKLILHKKHKVLLDYTRQHPSSYVALWDLVERMENGYEPVLDSIYMALSPSLKGTHTGKQIAKRLQSAKATAIGQRFPTLDLMDATNRSVSIPVTTHSTYTLIDFWFSHCGPCLSEFPQLKEIFTTYKPKGFNIIGISIDKEADINDWRKIINEKELSWEQYLDVGGKHIVNELSIGLFPSNLLLDKEGRVIRKNISPVQLNKFLAEKM